MKPSLRHIDAIELELQLDFVEQELQQLYEKAVKHKARKNEAISRPDRLGWAMAWVMFDDLRRAISDNDAKLAASSALGLLINFLELEPDARARRKSSAAFKNVTIAEAANNRARTAQLKAVCQNRAELIWKQYPELSAFAVAKRISKQVEGAKMHTVRKYIKKS